MVENRLDPLTKEEELSCLRAVLERILRVMDEGLFVDYQMEKFGRIVKGKSKIKDEDYEKFV